jgi:hypothetical protein
MVAGLCKPAPGECDTKLQPFLGLFPPNTRIFNGPEGSWVGGLQEALVFSVSVPISLAASEATSRLHFKASVTRSGQPATAEEVKVTLVGDGSLQPGHDAKQLVRETDASGVASVTWYRRSIFGRDIKATLTVESSHSDCAVTLEPVEAPPAFNTGWTRKAR